MQWPRTTRNASRGEGRGWVGSDGPFTVEVCASRVTCPITMCGNPGHDRKSGYVGMLGATVRYRPVRGGQLQPQSGRMEQAREPGVRWLVFYASRAAAAAQMSSNMRVTPLMLMYYTYLICNADHPRCRQRTNSAHPSDPTECKKTSYSTNVGKSRGCCDHRFRLDTSTRCRVVCHCSLGTSIAQRQNSKRPIRSRPRGRRAQPRVA